MFVMISSKRLDFNGIGKSGCSILGSCWYGCAREAGYTGEICFITVWGCSSGGYRQVRCTAAGGCSSGGIGDVPCATVGGCSSGDSGLTVWAITGSSSSGWTLTIIKSMPTKSLVPPSLISSLRNCFTCLSRLNFLWNLFWQYLQILFCSSFFLFFVILLQFLKCLLMLRLVLAYVLQFSVRHK